MLILTRKVGESITIGKDIKIKIVSIDQNQVKLGFDAPLDVVIFRDELITKVKNQNIEASSSFHKLSPDEIKIIKK
ncbi:MAG: carbon storage regulator CsrA [Campylobacteraceae bacterium]|nr:carbon storage regulator CsrA [Campylobacteraceae bacterium]